MPTSMSGNAGPAAKAAAAEIEALQAAAGPDLPVVAHDERLTTVTAQRALAGAKVKKGDRRGLVDQVAAAVMLQSWLDVQTGRHEHQRTPRRHKKLIFGTFGVMVLVAAVGAFWLMRQINPPGDPGPPVTVAINAGSSASGIAHKLEDENVLTSARVFRIYLKMKGEGSAFHAGEYELQERWPWATSSPP